MFTAKMRALLEKNGILYVEMKMWGVDHDETDHVELRNSNQSSLPVYVTSPF